MSLGLGNMDKDQAKHPELSRREEARGAMGLLATMAVGEGRSSSLTPPR